MRDVISNETIKEINEVIDEILTNIDNNVRNIQIGEGAVSLPTLLSYTNYDGQTYNIHGSTFTHHIIIDDANGRTTSHIEDGDILTTVGDKNGRQIGAVDEKISGHSNYEYFRESLYSVATDSYGYEFDKKIPFDIARNYDSGITGFSFNIREQYNEHSISNASCTVMTYKLTNISVGATFTVTFRGQFHGDFLEDKDSYIVINERFNETGSTIPMPIGDASVEIIKDDQTHNYSITCTNSTQFTDLYLHFYFKVDSFNAFDVDSFLVSDMDLGVIRNSFYHDGESYSFLQGGGGGTSDLDAIELTYAEYQALTPAEKTDPDKIYFITDYPSGSGVVINPTGTATDTAETIEVDGTIYDFAGTDADAVHTADIGVAGGVAELDSNGKVPSAQLPTYPTVGNGTITIQKNGTNVDAFTTNQSSNKTVNITMSKSDVGLGNVDNTSDANKPISIAMQAALDGKADASDVGGVKTVTGNPISISDGSETYADELSVDLEPIQSGSGTPSPSNVRPIQGYDIVNVDRCGKNLFDGALKQGASSEYVINTNKLKVKPNTTYYWVEFNWSNSGSKQVFFYDLSNSLISYQDVSGNSFTTPANCVKVTIQHYKSGGLSIPTNPQIVISTTLPTQYEPYNGQTVSLQLGQTVYGATVDVANGVMVVDRACVDGGSLTWYYWQNNDFYAYLSDKRSITNTDIVLSYYPTVYGQDKAAYCLIGNESQRKSVYVRDSSYAHDATGASALKTALTGQQIVYPLATPITIPLTPAQLKLLKGYNYISSNGTTINLTYQPDNAVGDAVGEAEKFVERFRPDTDIVDTFNLYNGNTKVGSVSLLSNGFKLLYINSIDDGSVFGMNIPDKYVPKGPYQRAVVCLEDGYANPRIIEIYQNHITVTEDKFEQGDTYGTGLYY